MFSVLIVDDEKKLTDLIAETLKGFNVFKTVLTAYDGADAIRKLENQKFDMIILDLGMPKKDGLEVLNFLKDEGITKTKVIVISGEFTPQNLTEAKEFTSYFLAKPFKIPDLKLKIGQVLKEAKSTSS